MFASKMVRPPRRKRPSILRRSSDGRVTSHAQWQSPGRGPPRTGLKVGQAQSATEHVTPSSHCDRHLDLEGTTEDRCLADNCWPAVRSGVIEALRTWCRPDDGYFELSSRATFDTISLRLTQWSIMQNAQTPSPRTLPARPHERGHTRRSRSPSPSFRPSSRPTAPRANCILCGLDDHDARACTDTSTCSLTGRTVRTRKGKDREVCFDFNIRRGCFKRHAHGEHVCSVCLRPEHSAQSCDAGRGRRRGY